LRPRACTWTWSSSTAAWSWRPLTGLADAIVDLVSTGNTLKANHLVEVERIMDISSHLVVNQAALKLKQAPLRRIIDAFASAIPAEQN
jgi:ATP phosphoribosyltransferase